jgi:hypothetical protein
MRDQRSRKTEVPSKQKFPHGRMAIIGRLVMLSVCMLVFGGTRTLAQTGQDARCAAYTGQAHGLCTAAVANGCFDGVQSPDCDALTANWEERCRSCKGEPPWLRKPVTCPCADAVESLGLEGSAVALYNAYLNEDFGGGASSVLGCLVTSSRIAVDLVRVTESGLDFRSLTLFLAITGDEQNRCRYGWAGANLTIFDSGTLTNLSDDEVVACQEDIRLVANQFPECR